MSKPAALRLPDPLLVRLYREGTLGDVKDVQLDPERNVTVTFENGTTQRFIHLKDVGWIPDADGTCAT